MTTVTSPPATLRRFLLEQLRVQDGRCVWTLFVDDHDRPEGEQLEYAAAYLGATMHPDIEWDDAAAQRWAADLLMAQGVDALGAWAPVPAAERDGEAAYLVTESPR